MTTWSTPNANWRPIDNRTGRNEWEPRIRQTQLIEAIEELRPRGRSSVLDGACGYAIEILSTLGLIERAVVVLGSVFDGELRVLRDLPVPPDRQPLDVRAMRETVGKVRFAELLAVGARMSYEEILDHMVAALADAS